MPLNFPSSPVLDQTYTSANRQWKWNGTAWDLNTGLLPSGAGASGPIPDTALTMNTNKVLGRTSASSGNIEELTVAGKLKLASGVLSGTDEYTTLNITASSQSVSLTEAAHSVIKLTTSTISSAFALYLPPLENTYVIWNSTSFVCSVYVATAVNGTTAAGSSIDIPNNARMLIFSDGTNALDQTNYLSNLTLATVLPVTSGGTGTNSSTGTGSVVLFSGAFLSSPTITSADLGTPTAIDLTNATNVPPATPPTRLVSSNSSILNTDGVLFASGTITLTLPAATGNAGKTFTIKNTGTGMITIQGAQTIDGNANIVLEFTNTAISLVSNGTTWSIT